MNDLEKKKSLIKNGRNIFIHSIACERRELDAQKIFSYLDKNNYKKVDDPNDADYILLMSCGATKSISNIFFETLKKFKEYNAELIVVGCIPETNKEELEKIFKGKTLSTKNLDKIDNIFPKISVKFGDIEDEHSMWQNFNKRNYIGAVKRINSKVKFSSKITTFFIDNILMKILGKNFKKVFPFNSLFTEYGNYYISISRGCIHKCTYCVIRKAVGSLESKPLDQCLKEFNLGLNEGFKIFVLEADDIGPYGVDIGSSLPELLEKITNIDGNYSLIISHTHPFWIIKYADELEKIVKTKKVKSIFISIQSGNNRVLKLMGRPYPKEKLVKTILRLKNLSPDLEIGTDLMVGFPTEKIEEFRETLELIEQVHFDFGVIFPFSCHEGTKASEIEPRIPSGEMKRRIREALKFLRTENYFTWYFRSTGFITFYTR